MPRALFTAALLLASVAAPALSGEARETDFIVQQLRRVIGLRRQVAEITEKQERVGLTKGGHSLQATLAHIDAEVRLAEREEALRGGLAPLTQAEARNFTQGDPIAAKLQHMINMCKKHASMAEARLKAGIDTQIPVLQARVAEAEAVIRLGKRAEVLRARGPARGRATKPSDVLNEAFVEILADFVIARGKEGKLPPEATKPEFVVKNIQAMEKAFPGILHATPQQQARLAAGKFDDEANRRALEAAVKTLNDLGAELPALAQTVIQKHRAGDLKGAKLEVGRRLLEAIVTKASPRADEK